MSTTIDITEDDFFIALRAFLIAIVPGDVEVIQAQGNRVPEPTAPDFIVMTATDRKNLSTNYTSWDRGIPTPDTLKVRASTELTFQLDIHGPRGADFAQMIAILTRDYYATAKLESTVIAPLYATDGKQMPFINGENQYENRWVMDIVLQANPTVSTPQEFASIVDIILKPIGG